MCSCQSKHCILLQNVCTIIIAYFFIQSINPKIKMIASEPKNADDCARSFAAGKRLKNEIPPDTICDALK